MKNEEYINHMEAIYTIYQEKSFTRAAEKLYISQPALSFTVKKVESELGYPIFERSGKEVSLTQIGVKVIKAISDIMRIKSKLSAEIDDILKLKKGSIVIGSTTFIASYILPNILRRFRNKYPNIEISIVVDQSTELEEKLESEQLDIIIDNVTSYVDWYSYTPLLKEHILIGVPLEFTVNEGISNYRISPELIKTDAVDYEGLPKLPVALLRDEKFILLKRGNKLRQISRQIFEESHCIINTTMEFDRLHTAVSYANAGFGICFLTDTTLKYGNAFENLYIYAPDTEFSDLTLYIIYKKNRYLTNAASELVKFMKETQAK